MNYVENGTVIESQLMIEKFQDVIRTLPIKIIKQEDIKSTAAIVIDMINGFAKEGALASPIVDGISSNIAKNLTNLTGSTVLFFVDQHVEGSAELDVYPSHCLLMTEEAEIVPELQMFLNDDTTVIGKNSVNGFFAEGFMDWFKENENVERYVVMGCCTDICILNFTLSLKSYLNQHNIRKEVIVPIDSVATFDNKAHNHPSYVMGLMALKLMYESGITLVKSID